MMVQPGRLYMYHHRRSLWRKRRVRRYHHLLRCHRSKMGSTRLDHRMPTPPRHIPLPFTRLVDAPVVAGGVSVRMSSGWCEVSFCFIGLVLMGSTISWHGVLGPQYIHALFPRRSSIWIFWCLISKYLAIYIVILGRPRTFPGVKYFFSDKRDSKLFCSSCYFAAVQASQYHFFFLIYNTTFVSIGVIMSLPCWWQDVWYRVFLDNKDLPRMRFDSIQTSKSNPCILGLYQNNVSSLGSKEVSSTKATSTFM